MNKEMNLLISTASDLFEAVKWGQGKFLYTKITQNYFSTYENYLNFLASIPDREYQSTVMKLQLRLKRFIDALLTNTALLEHKKDHFHLHSPKTSEKEKSECKDCVILADIERRLAGVNVTLSELYGSILILQENYNEWHSSGKFDNFFRNFLMRWLKKKFTSSQRV